MKIKGREICQQRRAKIKGSENYREVQFEGTKVHSIHQMFSASANRAYPKLGLILEDVEMKGKSHLNCRKDPYTIFCL